jgi:hypothetical protein
MAITTLDGLIASTKQRVRYTKTATRTTIANGWFSVIDLAGQPGAGVLAGTSTTAGVVPTDLTNGYPIINAFGGGASGYLGRVSFGNTVACRIAVFDRLWLGGAYAFNANTALTGQPSFAGRVPGTNYAGLEIWCEQVTAATGNQAVNVTYANQGGTGSRTTGAVGIGAAQTVGRCWQLPLQAGDSGVSRIDNVTGTVATVGTFNVMVLRRLAEGRVPIANGLDRQSVIDVGALLEVYHDSAFFVMIAADSTSSGLSDVDFQVVNG